MLPVSVYSNYPMTSTGYLHYPVSCGVILASHFTAIISAAEHAYSAEAETWQLSWHRLWPSHNSHKTANGNLQRSNLPILMRQRMVICHAVTYPSAMHWFALMCLHSSTIRTVLILIWHKILCVIYWDPTVAISVKWRGQHALYAVSYPSYHLFEQIIFILG